MIICNNKYHRYLEKVAITTDAGIWKGQEAGFRRGGLSCSSSDFLDKPSAYLLLSNKPPKTWWPQTTIYCHLS